MRKLEFQILELPPHQMEGQVMIIRRLKMSIIAGQEIVILLQREFPLVIQVEIRT